MSPDKKNDNPQLKNSHSSNSTDNNTTPKLKSPIVEERGLGSSKKPQSPSKDIHKQQDNRVPDETKNPNDLNTTPSIENSKKTIEINREFWNKHPALLTQKKRAKYSLFLDGVKFDANAFKNIENSGWRYTKERQLDDWWYDINKDFDRADNALCAGITSANWLHYWLRQNKKYVDDYLKDSSKGFYDVVENGTTKKQFDLRELMKYYEDNSANKSYKVWKSNMFEFFKFRYKSTFVNPNMLVDHYLNGYSYNAAKDKFGGSNTESKYKLPELHKSFFGDVFGKHILTKKTNVSHIWQKETFSKTLIDALVKNKPLGISHNNKFSKRTTGHIINVWGADFDENYNVVGLYITNSDDPKSTYKLKDDTKERLIKRCVLQCLI
ncbi:IdeS/Mac family cysteine endopeptidase [Mycoplasmopsis cynos]|nr:IdeS/Mac family cysteine endopeptidase [Mycoplasmopsis cynos]